MAAKLDCPRCGRKLTPAVGYGVVTCDGCESTFNPASVHRRPPPLWKRTVGIILALLGGISLVERTIMVLPDLDLGNTDAIGRLAGSVLFGIFLLAWGLSLMKGKTVLVSVPDNSRVGPGHPA